MADQEKSPDQMDLVELRKLVNALSANFKRAVWGGTIAVSVLSILGLSKISDIENKARERVDSAVAKGAEFFDLVINGQTRMNGFQYETAIGYFEAARSLKPDDDYVFYSLLTCYVNAAKLDSATRLVADAERAGLFDRKFNQTWTLLNAGRLYTLTGLENSGDHAKAEYFLERARRAAELQNGGDLSYVLYAQAILEYVKGNRPGCTDYLKSLVKIDPRAREWPHADRS